MHIVSIDRSRVDRHLVRPSDLTKQLSCALTNILAQNRIAIFRSPTRCGICSPSPYGNRADSPACPKDRIPVSPKAEGFTVIPYRGLQ